MKKQERLLEIFFRCLKGEGISIKKLSEEYGVSAKSISRDVNALKTFLADNRELVGNVSLDYSYQDKCYYLFMDSFLSNKELLALAKVIIGTRAFSKRELLALLQKLKQFTTLEDRKKLNALIRNEIYHYVEIRHECNSVEDMVWQLTTCIDQGKEVSIEYYKMDRSYRTYRLYPASLFFSENYFYLIAFKTEDEKNMPVYFRVDRIKHITEHRGKREAKYPEFDEGLLRKRSLLMWSGKLRTICFIFTGPSVQAVLDKLPTAKILEHENGEYLIEAEVYGDGIKMWLLSQGSWVKVIAPEDFVAEIKHEIENMKILYKKE